MNTIKVKVYKRVLKEVAEKYSGAENFINNKIDETCSQEMSAGQVIYFLVDFLQLCFLVSFLAVKYFKLFWCIVANIFLKIY